MTIYSTQINSQTNTQNNGLSQNKIDFTLLSNQSSVRVSSTFINNTLTMLYLSEYSGTLAKTQPASSTVGLAKDFLWNYQSYTGNSFYGRLASTLNDITGDVNSTSPNGNVTLRVINSEGATVDYIWTYTDPNGICAQSKNVVLSYYQGQLNCFLDNWNLYKIVGVPQVSRQQAITTALAAIQNYSYQLSNGNITSTVSVAGFQISPESLNDTTLSYVNCPNSTLARGNDPFSLYPSWYVPLGFNKFYPGGVSGIAVTVWADTGIVSSTNIMTADYGLTNAAQTTATQNISQNPAQDVVQSYISFSAPVTIIVGILCIGALITNKRKASKLAGDRKLFNPKVWGLLLCSIMLVGAAMSTVRADSVFPNSTTRIYGSLNGGNGSPAQPQQEQTAAYWVQGQLDNDFAASGYATNNDVGSLTTVSNVESYAQYDENNYDRSTVFQFGHMAAFGQGYAENTGNSIWYYNISPYTQNGNVQFVFLWVCAQAETSSSTVGITPIVNAWLNHPQVSSTDGYNSPDNSLKAFIGFYGESPQIGNTTETFENHWTLSADNFIQDFYYNALVNGYDVRDSLNQASISFFGTTFTSSIFYTGYNCWLPAGGMYNHSGWYPQDFGGGTLNSMHVFGDGAAFLFQPTITFSANNGLSPTFYLDNRPCSSQVNVWDPEVYTISASSIPGYTFDHFTYNGQNLGNPSNVELLASGTITAYYDPVENYVSTSATADVAITPSCQSVPGQTISWVCSDDYGNYYCYVNSVVIDGVSYPATDFGGSNEYGSWTCPDYGSHTIQVNSAPYYYPVTVYEWADGYYGNQVVNSWTQYDVAWEETGGPAGYCHGSDIYGGGPLYIYCDDGVTDPWDSSYCPFNYAYTDNWNGQSFGTYQYSNPISIMVYTWGNTENVYYQWQGYGYGMASGTSSAAGISSTLTPPIISTPTSGSLTSYGVPVGTPYTYDSTTNTYIPVPYNTTVG